MPKPLTVNKAAAQMGITSALLREALKQGRFPFGAAVKMEKRWAFYINPVTFDLYMRGELGDDPQKPAAAHKRTQ